MTETVDAYITRRDTAEREWEERYEDTLSDYRRAFARGPHMANTTVPFGNGKGSLADVIADAFAGKERPWLDKLLEIMSHVSVEGPEAGGKMLLAWMEAFSVEQAEAQADGR